MKRFILFMAGIAALHILIGTGWAWRFYTAPVEGTVDAEVMIEGGHNRIAKYEHFYDLCAVIQTDQKSLQVQKDMLDYYKVGSKDYNRTVANIGGIEAQLSRNVNQYNADARKSYTDARFKASDLPYQINVDSGTSVSCN